MSNLSENQRKKREKLRRIVEAATNEMHADDAAIDSKRHAEITEAFIKLAIKYNVQDMVIPVAPFETFGEYLDYFLPRFEPYMKQE